MFASLLVLRFVHCSPYNHGEILIRPYRCQTLRHSQAKPCTKVLRITIRDIQTILDLHLHPEILLRLCDFDDRALDPLVTFFVTSKPWLSKPCSIVSRCSSIEFLILSTTACVSLALPVTFCSAARTIPPKDIQKSSPPSWVALWALRRIITRAHLSTIRAKGSISLRGSSCLLLITSSCLSLHKSIV